MLPLKQSRGYIKWLTKRENASVKPNANASSLPSNQNADILFCATRIQNNLANTKKTHIKVHIS